MLRKRMRGGPALAGILFIAVMAAAIPGSAFSETTSALPVNRGFATVQEILTTSCSACHDWTGSYDSLVAGGKVIAGDPEKSLIYQKIATDEMPMEGDKLTADQKAFIKGWIAAGAPNNNLPIAVPAAERAPAQTAASKTPSSTSFLGFPDKRTFHAVTGFTSAACFVGAGVIGVVHLVDMMNAGHTYRDSINFDPDVGPESLRVAEIKKVWGDDSTLRWVHVGLIVAGETLYIGDAITGISMMTPHQPGKVTKHDIHRWAFFTHAALMVAQGLGFAETYALSTGQHDLVIGLGVAHAAVGVAIPAVMIGAGLENLLLPE